MQLTSQKKSELLEALEIAALNHLDLVMFRKRPDKPLTFEQFQKLKALGWQPGRDNEYFIQLMND